MSAAQPLLSRTWSVGKRYRVTLSIPRLEPGALACATCEWSPAMPDQMTHREQRDYITGRDAALREFRRQLRATVATESGRKPDEHRPRA